MPNNIADHSDQNLLSKIYENIVANQNYYLDEESKDLMIRPLQIMASILIITGAFALMFELKYFAAFSIDIYLGRLIATLIGFIILALTYFKFGKEHATILVHILLLTIIGSFSSIILAIPETIFVNSQLLALIIFTSALFLSWDIKNQIVVAIYYNILFAFTVLMNDNSIYLVPNFVASFIFVVFISLMSVVASAVNYKLRKQILAKTFEAKGIFEHATEGIFKVSIGGDILIANPAFIDILSYSSEEKLISSTKFNDLFSSQKEYEQFYTYLFEEGIVKNFETIIIDQYKEKIDVSFNAHLSFDKKGNPDYFIGSCNDITEQRKARDKIRKYNEELRNLNESKDKFFSIIAHDLLSPFTALLGYSEIMVNEYQELDRKEIGEFSSDIYMVATKAHGLLENLLNWSRIQTGRITFTPFSIDLKNIVNDVVLFNYENSKRKGIKIENLVEPNIFVFADNNMLETIFRNLISNSIKFTKDGGKISIFSSNKEEFIQVTVSDSGMGISEEDIKKLFKIDVHHTQIGTGEEKGTGLGLILCKEFVSKNGGDIWVESKLGKGSNFIFTLKSQKME